MLKGKTNFFLDGSVGGAPQSVGGTNIPPLSKAVDSRAPSTVGPAQAGVGAAAQGGN